MGWLLPWSGQNKSRAVVKMWQCLSMIFEIHIRIVFLKSGHSHMQADRVVALAKAKLDRVDSWSLRQIITDPELSWESFFATIFFMHVQKRLICSAYRESSQSHNPQGDMS